MNEVPYGDGRAVAAAIKDAARGAYEADSSVQKSDVVKQMYFDRFLSRVFSDGGASEWVLKGGAGMLARVPNARATMDIDLYRRAQSLAGALDDLRRLAAVDLGDHVRFEYVKHAALIAGNQQPYRDCYRVTFSVFIGAKSAGTVNVDLVTRPSGPRCVAASWSRSPRSSSRRRGDASTRATRSDCPRALDSGASQRRGT